MKITITKKAGKFYTTFRAGNNEIISSNKGFDTKQAAYKNILSNARGWAKLFGYKYVTAKKEKDAKAIIVDLNVLNVVTIPVKEINC